ncbi:Mitochondrial dicarboxylate transporter [Coemansia sp. RSA 2706]|nr:Mitochondrial dicarboxylate transporter [Coemansia sp. RSA 2711]KAJ2303607.1 Mitochondrial dicarboxylate transporter [Coemansia sp. RSA 2706]KAJ2306318.1 Mitochondrial dicarboxylate transporter [Coemansia sp. RSA 2705]KAJ2313080.1 Mitochondrial dicarboxylate transporter [Coemansia sp. RSA 2704]KAJ2368193.1 Mitochondrial dicarboxylate transporter [Coemansia sp. RSA 2610]KAJ2722666.1 Mitochondrial dicarboxylate transporter [Coemansia sp. Cherry 401B]
MAAACFTHPIDLIKVHLQTSTRRTRALRTMRAIVHETGVLGLYSGLSAALLRQGTYTMTRFAVYDLAKAKLASEGRPPTGAQLAAATLLSGVAGGVVGNPAEILNVRMQNDQALPAHRRRNYRNAAHGLVVMLRSEGVRALAIGLAPSLVRATLATASQFVSYDLLKARLLRAGYPDSVSVHFAASFAAGLVATTVCSPADVIKSRVMASLRRSGSARRVPGMWQTARDIWRAEGLHAFFKGWVPAYMRLCPQLVITFVIYEKLRKVYFARYR